LDAGEKIGFGEVASMTGKSILSQVFEDGLPLIVLPKPDNQTVSKNYPLENEEPYVMFFVPIFAPSDNVDSDLKSSDNVIGAMMIRSSSLISELRKTLSEALIPDAQCYMIDINSHFTSDVKDQDRLRSLPEMEELREKNGKILLHCLDPGTDLFNASPAKRESPETWIPTLAARGLMFRKSGENIDGYRDYRGVTVIGAWIWIDQLERGIIIEVPYADAFRGIEFVSAVFLVLLALPLSIVAALLGVSLFRNLRDIDFSNRSLGAYRLSKKLGEGGLGVVYLGVHKTLHRPAAIKLIKPNVVNPATIQRFEREVRLAASFDHPHAVHIYDFGVSKDGHVYCVMQLVEGITLAHLMQFTGGIPIARTLHILKQVSETLSEAHEFGLVHRDIKPQNVMISSVHPRDYVKIVDFGLAKHIADPIRGDQTATKVVIGTPGFIAPERIESPWITDPRIDTFSFGVLGLFLLTGKVPSLNKTYQAIKESILSRSDSSSLSDDVLHELINVLLLCCNPDPGKRPATMSAVHSTLSLLARNMPWQLEEAEQWWESNANTLQDSITNYQT
nr:serine/threonine protein kinase [Pirellula sp.]